MPCFLVILLTAAAAAEVMDKEPSLSEIWMAAALAAVLAWFLGRRFPRLGCLALVPSLPVLMVVEESYDKFVGQAIVREAGPGYIAQAHLAIGLVLLAYASGLTRRPGVAR
ncbi:MAG: hypothetical protein KF760_34480 [Candidatus Eremiobacteraeota bacterium]|nr:hypothetical protein [Candidatus Eremiobacteraeota bacterium]MCW5868722.1 hypothetical protein [Candidatus Eremiobacteraeota bacterium]